MSRPEWTFTYYVYARLGGQRISWGPNKPIKTNCVAVNSAISNSGTRVPQRHNFLRVSQTFKNQHGTPNGLFMSRKFQNIHTTERYIGAPSLAFFLQE